MIIRLLKKKIFRFLAVGTALLTLILHSSIYHLPAHAADTIPLAQLPTGSIGSNTLDIRETTLVPQNISHGAFRIQCIYSHMNYDDPIVFPNQSGASHLHTFFGNTLTNANSTYQSLTSSGNSTCKGGITNRSAYWVPSLLDSAGKPVAPAQMLFYYKSFSPESVKNIPNGLRMVVGNSKSTTPQDANLIIWECRGSTGQLAKANYIPSCTQGNTLRETIVFPSCWDGFNLDSPNHKAHMSYPVRGGCPLSHPVKLPDTSIKVVWNVTDDSTDKWRLSSDMYDPTLPGGYSTHADWFEAWKPEIRKTWFTNCLPAKKECGVGLLGNGQQLFFKKV